MLKEQPRRDYRRQNLRWVYFDFGFAELKVISMKSVSTFLRISSWLRVG